jgi:sulfide dehydrogenase cytochrome subunit
MSPTSNPSPRRRGVATHDVLTALTLGLAPLAAAAATPPGQLLSSQCAQCHGTNGQAVSGFESISGKSASDMFKTLVEMKNRPAETIMDRQARGYTDAQLRLIAEYLAKLPPAGATTQEK